MRVIEIFKSIEGEGVRVGKVVSFVRLAGCNLRCTYCDTKYSYEGGKDMTIVAIVDQLQDLGCKDVTITGGEPLIHEKIKALLEVLSYNKFNVNVETNGSVWVKDFHDYNKSGMFTIDYKSLSSGMSAEMKKQNLSQARPQDCIKFVVASRQDLKQMRALLSSITCDNIYVSPVFGRIEPAEIAKFLIENDLHCYGCTMQVQLHKIIWDPEMRGV